MRVQGLPAAAALSCKSDGSAWPFMFDVIKFDVGGGGGAGSEGVV